jgi:hypothetical protein
MQDEYKSAGISAIANLAYYINSYVTHQQIAIANTGQYRLLLTRQLKRQQIEWQNG